MLRLRNIELPHGSMLSLMLPPPIIKSKDQIVNRKMPECK
jgi:hypothetical protein